MAGVRFVWWGEVLLKSFRIGKDGDGKQEIGRTYIQQYVVSEE